MNLSTIQALLQRRKRGKLDDDDGSLPPYFEDIFFFTQKSLYVSMAAGLIGFLSSLVGICGGVFRVPRCLKLVGSAAYCLTLNELLFAMLCLDAERGWRTTGNAGRNGHGRFHIRGARQDHESQPLPRFRRADPQFVRNCIRLRQPHDAGHGGILSHRLRRLAGPIFLLSFVFHWKNHDWWSIGQFFFDLLKKKSIFCQNCAFLRSKFQFCVKIWADGINLSSYWHKFWQFWPFKPKFW